MIFNPIKVSPQFRETATASLDAAGWTDVLWLETSEDDPGQGRTAEALEAAVDRVIVAGGDGTVRAVAEALSGSGTPLGIVPAGTANLLDYNLGLPPHRGAAPSRSPPTALPGTSIWSRSPWTAARPSTSP